MSRPWLVLAAAALSVACIALDRRPAAADEDVNAASLAKLDPAQWGSDHVGQPLPEYVTGDECLFCHREIGPDWPANQHQRTIRLALPDEPALMALAKLEPNLADEVQFVMGEGRSIRFLKRSEEYGKLLLCSASYLPPTDEPKRDGTVENFASARWDAHTFGRRCAGCHATAVDTQTRAFSATSIDCFACHGSVELAHTKDPRRALLSKQNQPPEVVTSVCGQCHLRGGKSASSGLPYPNTFVAGDNLMKDFRVDLSADALDRLLPVDRHIVENTRDVVLLGRRETTCLSCHDVHAQSIEKHQALPNAQSCSTCHVPGSDNTQLRKSFIDARGPLARSKVCDY